MKGDEVVEARHECGYAALLLFCWQPDWRLLSRLDSVSANGSDAGSLIDVALDSASNETMEKELAIYLARILEPDDVSVFEVDWVFAGHKPWNPYCSYSRNQEVSHGNLA